MTRCVHSMLCREFLLATFVALAPAALGSHALSQSTSRKFPQMTTWLRFEATRDSPV